MREVKKLKNILLPSTCDGCEYKNGAKCEVLKAPVGNCYADKAERDKREKAIEKYTGKSKN